MKTRYDRFNRLEKSKEGDLTPAVIEMMNQLRYDKLVIMDEDKRKEWEGLTPAAMKTLEDVFGENLARIETRLIVEMLTKAVINLQERLDKLEKDRKY